MPKHEARAGSEIDFTCARHIGERQLSNLRTRPNQLTPESLHAKLAEIQAQVDALGDHPGSRVAEGALSAFARFADAGTRGSVALLEVPNWAWHLPATQTLIQGVRLNLLGISSDMQILRRDTGYEGPYGTRIEKGEIAHENPVFLLERQATEKPRDYRQLVVIDGRDENAGTVLSYANTYSWSERHTAGQVLGEYATQEQIDLAIGQGWADRWKAPDTVSLLAAVDDMRADGQIPSQPEVAYFDRSNTIPA